MAVVGSASVVVRAITSGFGDDIAGALGKLGRVGETAGSNIGAGLSAGLGSIDTSALTNFANEAMNTKENFTSLVRTGYTVSTALAVVVGAISSLISGLVALGSAVIGAAGSLAVLGNYLGSFILAMVSAKLALGGVGEALGKLNKASAGGAQSAKQLADAERNLAEVIENNRETLARANRDVEESQRKLNQAIIDGQEEIQQLGFDAEDAALSEKKAALELEKAREALIRVQDLPPNSRARKEAELAFAEADLNLRRAIDANKDLAAEQDRIGGNVNNTQGVIDATNDLADAEAARAKTVRDNARAEVKAIEQVNAARAGSAGDDPYAGLNQSQIDFVNFLQGLKPLYEELQKVASDAFLPPLTEAIQTLVTGLYPTIVTGIGQISGALGSAVKSIADIMTSTSNVEKLTGVFESSATIIAELGKVIGNVWGIFLSILEAAAPLAEDFVKFLEEKTGALAAFFDTEEGKAKLEQFFTDAGKIMEKIGTIFGNVFGGFGKVIEANFGEGSGGWMILDWLERVTSGIGNIGGQAETTKEELRKFYQDVAGNFIKIMDSIGLLIDALGRIGANENIGKTFDALGRGVKPLENIITKAVDAGPALGDLVVAVLELFDALSDTGAPQVFFETLGGIVKAVADFLGSPAVKPVLDFLGQVFAFFSALGLVATILNTGFMIVIGIFLQIALAIVGVVGAIALLVAFPVIGWVIGIVAGIGVLIGMFVDLYNKSDEFRGFIEGIFGPMIVFFQGLWDQLVVAMQPLIEKFSELWNTLQAVLMPVLVAIGAIVGVAIMGAFNGIVFVLTTFVIPAITLLMNVVNFLLTPLKLLFDLIGTIAGAFVQLMKDGDLGKFFETSLGGVANFFKGVFNNVLGLVEGAVNFMIDMINGLTANVNNISGAIGIPAIPRIPRLAIPRLAEGGVIQAKTGGTMAIIGEAGRNERVEPLDKNGLSKRDNAMIDKLVAANNSGSSLNGVVINIHPSEGMDERELAEIVSRKLAFMMRKGAIA